MQSLHNFFKFLFMCTGLRRQLWSMVKAIRSQKQI